jgi:hypothetical protein
VNPLPALATQLICQLDAAENSFVVSLLDPWNRAKDSALAAGALVAEDDGWAILPALPSWSVP